MIESLEWSARVVNGVVYGHIDLVSEDYDAQDGVTSANDDGAEGDFESKAVWRNYHRCILSSVCWGHRGFCMATASSPFDIHSLDNQVFHVDPLPLSDDPDYSELAFGIYRLGHDAVAGHRIKFKKSGPACYTVEWSAKVANLYAGFTEFDEDVYIKKADVFLSGIAFGMECPAGEARIAFENAVVDPGAYREVVTDSQRVFIPIQ